MIVWYSVRLSREREREVQYDTVWSSCFQLDYIHVSMNQIATSKLKRNLNTSHWLLLSKIARWCFHLRFGSWPRSGMFCCFFLPCSKASLPAKNMHHNVTWEWTSPRTLRLMHHMRLICALRVAWHLAHLGTRSAPPLAKASPCFSAPPTPGGATRSASVTGHGMARMAQEAVNRRK